MKKFLFLLLLIASPAFGQGGQVGSPIYFSDAVSTTGPVNETYIENYDPGTDDMYCIGDFKLTSYGSVGTGGNPDTPDTWTKVGYGFNPSNCWQMVSYFGANANKHGYLSSSLDYVWIESDHYMDLIDYVTVSNVGSVLGGGAATTFVYDVENSQIVGGPYNGQTGITTPKKGYIHGKRYVTRIKLYARRIPGDADNDGDVLFDDYLVMSNNYNQSVSGGPDDGDFNSDGVVNFADFLLLSIFYQGSASDF